MTLNFTYGPQTYNYVWSVLNAFGATATATDIEHLLIAAHHNVDCKRSVASLAKVRTNVWRRDKGLNPCLGGELYFRCESDKVITVFFGHSQDHRPPQVIVDLAEFNIRTSDVGERVIAKIIDEHEKLLDLVLADAKLEATQSSKPVTT